MASRMQDKAAGIGFDWKSIDGVKDKISEELGELDYEIKHGTKEKVSSWKKKDKPAKTETKKSKFDWLKKLNPFKKSETEKK